MKWISDPRDLELRTEGRIAYITLNRPEKRNAVSLRTLTELRDSVLEFDDRTSVRCIVLEGAGKDFCSGADIGDDAEEPAYDQAEYRGSESVEDDLWQIRLRSELRQTMFKAHKPIIAKVHGHCLAVGTDIALNCDLVMAADDALIGFPATRALGSPANHMWLYLMGPQWAKRMLLTGDSIRGDFAARLGLVLESHPAAELGGKVDELAARIALMDPALAAAHKRVVNGGLQFMGWDLMQQLAAETDVRAHQAASLGEFRSIAAEKGLREALRWRDEPYGESELSLDDEAPR